MIVFFVSLVLALLAAYALVVAGGLWKRNAFLWLAAWLRDIPRRRRVASRDELTHVLFCFVDHYEPRWGRADVQTEHARVDRWVSGYPALCAGHRDADGRFPQHSFFFPSEEYRPEHIEKMTRLCALGYGEIEVHLHHDRDTAAGLRANLTTFLQQLDATHQALPRDPVSGRPLWSFIHGNWALDNSRPDGRWCGVNDEITILSSLGCYADFTMPSAPDVTQTSTVNRLYYATDDPARPKSHDRGIEVRVGGQPEGHMMIIQGPLGLRWKRRWGIPVPSIETGDIRASHPPTPERVDFWVAQGIHVAGRPDWLFVKIHTHGTQDRDMEALLGEPLHRMHTYLESRYNDGKKFMLHYVTARETYNIARAAEAGEQGNPGKFRDYIVPRPVFSAPSPS